VINTVLLGGLLVGGGAPFVTGAAGRGRGGGGSGRGGGGGESRRGVVPVSGGLGGGVDPESGGLGGEKPIGLGGVSPVGTVRGGVGKGKLGD
jgi:hypothetical protein